MNGGHAAMMIYLIVRLGYKSIGYIDHASTVSKFTVPVLLLVPVCNGFDNERIYETRKNKILMILLLLSTLIAIILVAYWFKQQQQLTRNQSRQQNEIQNKNTLNSSSTSSLLGIGNEHVRSTCEQMIAENREKYRRSHPKSNENI